jgi:hypothetical protein
MLSQLWRPVVGSPCGGHSALVVDPCLDQFARCLLASRDGLAASRFHPHATRSSWATCCCSIARLRPPLRAVSFNWRQMSPMDFAFPGHRQRSHAQARMAGNAPIAGGLAQSDVLFGMILPHRVRRVVCLRLFGRGRLGNVLPRQGAARLAETKRYSDQSGIERRDRFVHFLR